MKVKVKRQSIIEGLKKAGMIIPAKAGAAYLRAIWIKAENDYLHFMTTDASVEFTGVYQAEVEESGLVGVAGRTLVDLIQQFPEGEIEMTADIDKNTFVIKQGKRGRYKLPLYSPEWFQPLAEFPKESAVLWSGDVLSDIIDRVYYCIIGDEARDAMACLCLKPLANGKIEACGMDGHQFAMVTLINDDLCNILPKNGLLINKKYIADIKKLIQPGEIELNLNEKRLFLKGSDGTESFSIARGSDLEYPDYNVFLANVRDNGANFLKTPRKEMIEALKRISVFSIEGSQPAFHMSLGEREISVKSTGSDGSAQETLEAEYKGSLGNISFPTKDLIEIFNHFKSETVMMTFTGQEGPCSITGPEDKDYNVILMPMRVDEKVYYTEENL